MEAGDVLQDMVLDPDMGVFWRETLSRSLVGVMAISHDRRFVAVTRASGDRWERGFESTPIEIWEVASGLKRGELKGHGPVADLAFSPDDRCLASSSDDSTILIWDLERPLQPLKRGARLTEQELDECWRILFERDAARADLAIWKFIDSRDESLPYFGKKLRPTPVPDAGRIRNLFADLGSSHFKTRTRASEELARFGDLILPHIDQAIKETDSLEVRKRLEALAEVARASSRPFGSMTRIGEWRALEILEKVGSPPAMKLLRELANGAPNGQLTIAAKAALTRAKTRTKAAP
jgi:hypothetical protein